MHDRRCRFRKADGVPSVGGNGEGVRVVVAEPETYDQVSRQGDGDFLVRFRRDGGIVVESHDIEGRGLPVRRDGDDALVGLHVFGTVRDPPMDRGVCPGQGGCHDGECLGGAFRYADRVDAVDRIGGGEVDGPEGVVVRDVDSRGTPPADTPSALRQPGKNEIGKLEDKTFVAVALVIVYGFDGEGDGFFRLRNRQNSRGGIIAVSGDCVIRRGCGVPRSGRRNCDGGVRA